MERTSVATRTVVFTDLEDSTSFYASHGSGPSIALQRRIEFLTTQIFAQWGVEQLKAEGDGSMAVFSSASGALSACAALQQALRSMRVRQDLPEPHLRIGIAAGDVQLRADEDIAGLVPVEAKRLESASPRDGILVSRVVAEMDRGISGVPVEDFRQLELKGIEQTVVAGLADWQRPTIALSPAITLPAQFEESLESPFPFSNRLSILRRVVDQIVARDDDRRTLVMISGPEGMGKTRFMAELANDFRTAGDLVLVGHCASLAGSPLECLSEIVDQFCALADHDEELASSIAPFAAVLQGLSERVTQLRIEDVAAPALTPDHASNELFEALARFLNVLYERHGLIVMIEDLQYAPPDAIGFLRHYLRRPTQNAPLVVSVNPAVSSPHVAAFLEGGRASDSIVAHDLPALTLQGIEDLLLALPAHRLGIDHAPNALSEDGQTFAETLFRLSGGLPSLVALLVREAHDQSVASMDDADGSWRTYGDLARLTGLDGFRRVVQQRLARSPEEARVAAEEIAVLDARATIGLHARMSALDKASRDSSLEFLEQGRFISIVGSAIHYETEAVKRAVYETVQRERRAELHEQAAAALEAHAEAEHLRTPAGAIVAHLGEALGLVGRGARRTVAYGFLAGVQALDASNGTEAGATFSSALQLLNHHEFVDDDELRARLLVGIAEAAKLAGEDDADRKALAATEFCRQCDLSHLLAMSPGQWDTYFADHRVVDLIKGETQVVPDQSGLPQTAQRSVFVSYSHSDLKWLERLQVHLAPAVRRGLVDLWDDTRLRPGDKWRDEIERALDKAGAAVLLVTADFLASPFVASQELPRLLSAAKERGVTIVPIIVRASGYAEDPQLGQFEAFNDPDQPLEGLDEADRESQFAKAARAVVQAVERAR